MVGGIPGLKEWIVNHDPGLVQVPYPDGFRTEDIRFEVFEEALKRLHVEPRNVAGVLLETYQGGGSSFCPKEYIQQLRK